MRAWPALILAVVATAACSSTGGGGGPAAAKVDASCGLLERLADSAQPVEEADISDPAAFEDALDESVMTYVSTIDDLRDVLPDDLQGDLDRLEAAASQFRFQDAIDARVALEEYRQATCTDATVTSTTGATG